MSNPLRRMYSSLGGEQKSSSVCNRLPDFQSGAPAIFNLAAFGYEAGGQVANIGDLSPAGVTGRVSPSELSAIGPTRNASCQWLRVTLYGGIQHAPHRQHVIADWHQAHCSTFKPGERLLQDGTAGLFS